MSLPLQAFTPQPHALALAAATLLASAAALAQSSPDPVNTTAPGAAAASADAGLGAITITAQKREQSAQQTGLAVTVLSGEALAARGVRKVNALQNEVPNLEVEPAFGGSQAQFRLRGVGFQDYATNNAGAVTVYVDEVALPLPVQTQGLLFDLDRVEVLRGPQGTLYGRNTTGGAVNFLTRQPTQRFEAAGTLGLGSYGAVEAEGHVSGALATGLRGRLALATQQGGGWQVRRDTGERLGDKDVTGLRGQLAWDAAPGLQLNLSLSLGRDRSEGQGLYAFTAQPAVASPPYPVPKAALPADSGPRQTGWGFAPAFLAHIGWAPDAKPGRDNHSRGLTAKVDWDLADLRLTSITAFDRFQRRELADYDAQTAPLAETYFESQSHNFSQELRLASRQREAAFNWLAGVYAAQEKLDESYWSSFAESFGLATVLTSYRQQVRTGSLFGQADWRLTPRLKLVAGLRQEHEQRRRDDFRTRSIGPDIAFNGPSSGAFSQQHSSGKLALEAQLTPRFLAHGSVSRGVKSGGFTAYNTFNDLALTPFKPEVLLAYEAGFKADPSRQLRLNATVFHYDYRDQQILDAIQDSNTGATVGKIVNAPRSTIQGLEIELTWKPGQHFSLGQFLGYKDGHFKEYVALSPAADLSGQALYFPRLSYGLAADSRFNLGAYGLLAHVDASYHDKSRSFLNRINPSHDFNTPAYWLANARLELAPVAARWTASLYVRNLFNQRHDLTRNFFDLPLPVAAAGAPRTLGVQVRHEFP